LTSEPLRPSRRKKRKELTVGPKLNFDDRTLEEGDESIIRWGKTRVYFLLGCSKDYRRGHTKMRLRNDCNAGLPQVGRSGAE